MYYLLCSLVAYDEVSSNILLEGFFSPLLLVLVVVQVC